MTSKLHVVAVVCLSQVAFSSCWVAAMVNSRPAESVAFADDAVPAGSGWLCFARNDGRTNERICERTAEACDDSRLRAQRQGNSVSVCEPAKTASCYFVDTDPTKAAVLVPIGDKARTYGCFATASECRAFRDPYAAQAATGNGVVAVSACRELL